MICQTDISNVKAELAKNIGRKVIIKGKKERKKFFEEKAIIKNTYPAHFYVKNEEKETNTSYKYEDLLTNKLKISIFDGKEYFPLVPTILKPKF